MYPWFKDKHGSAIIDFDRFVAEDKKQGLDHSFDCLHLDLNGYIHVAMRPPEGSEKKGHAEEKAKTRESADKNLSSEDRQRAAEDLIFSNVMENIERLTILANPSRLLNLAMDGIAPRAKMNQQRSRRFKKSSESHRDSLAEQAVREDREAKGKPCPPLESAESKFDSNVISAGTRFMDRFARYLRKWIVMRQKQGSIFSRLTILFSDTLSAGEGEHKILAWIRSQASCLRHIVVGDDADLILLGISVRRQAPNFYILRSRNRADGYDVIDVAGIVESLGGRMYQDAFNMSKKTDNPVLPLLDVQRMLDDFVYLSFFVGNDFLPPLPTISIFEGGLELLVEIYITCLVEEQKGTMRGAKTVVRYLTNTHIDIGDEKACNIPVEVNTRAVVRVLDLLASVEQAIVEKRFIMTRNLGPSNGGHSNGNNKNGNSGVNGDNGYEREVNSAKYAAQQAEAALLTDNTNDCMVGLCIAECKKVWKTISSHDIETKQKQGSKNKLTTMSEYAEKCGWRWQYYTLKLLQHGEDEGCGFLNNGQNVTSSRSATVRSLRIIRSSSIVHISNIIVFVGCASFSLCTRSLLEMYP